MHSIPCRHPNAKGVRHFYFQKRSRSRDIFKDLSKPEKSNKGKPDDSKEVQIEDPEIFKNAVCIGQENFNNFRVAFEPMLCYDTVEI